MNIDDFITTHLKIVADRFNMDIAIGVDLDNLAAMLGVSRTNYELSRSDSDEDFRKRIRFELEKYKA